MERAATHLQRLHGKFPNRPLLLYRALSVTGTRLFGLFHLFGKRKVFAGGGSLLLLQKLRRSAGSTLCGHSNLVLEMGLRRFNFAFNTGLFKLPAVMTVPELLIFYFLNASDYPAVQCSPYVRLASGFLNSGQNGARALFYGIKSFGLVVLTSV